MSKVEELEREIEQLLPEDFAKLSTWMARRRKEFSQDSLPEPLVLRDHQAFLNGYTPEDEGLYDNAQGG
jgi:hypothetical protein